ncbi:MAG: carboxylating nicotinate-nucleotide diphosphorylase [Actinobacteria bacterium]|nr:MAG: carboxylating nicotinate-nucleotide diphosphorylase [Actinomycetota bacterium]
MQMHGLSDSTAQQLVGCGLVIDDVRRLISVALEEDLKQGADVTTHSTVRADQRSTGSFGSRATGCVAGIDVVGAVLEMVCGAQTIVFTKHLQDGARVSPGDKLAMIEAPTRGLLTAERTALNLLCHLSGVATATSQWVDAISGTGAQVRDTRKTTPGLRALEKYAVRCGGGVNHRMSLSDAALVKDNHIVAAGGVAQAFALVRAAAPNIAIEIEVDTLDQLVTALQAGADLVLLDNMAPDVLTEAVAIATKYFEETGRDVILEASGGLKLESARAVGVTGVRYISVGALTHSAPVLDIGLDLEH